MNLSSANDNANVQQIRVIEKIKHPLYKASTAYNDIALVKLEKDMQFNERVRPACLPYSLPDNTAPEVTAIGLNMSMDHSKKLVKVNTKLVSRSECNDSYKKVLPSGIVADFQVCVEEKAPNICVPHTGPVVTVNNDHPNMYSVIGIISIGKSFNCDTPVVCTRVYIYVPWIESIVWSNS